MNRGPCGTPENRNRCIELGRVLATIILVVTGARDGVAQDNRPSSLSLNPRLLTTARAIQQLSAAEAKAEHPVLLRGVITYIGEEDGDLFVQDRTAGIYVFLKGSRTTGVLKTGVRVLITGNTTPGDFSPCIIKAVIRVIGPGQFPIAKRYPMDALLSGKEDGHWVGVGGIVHSAKVVQGRLLLQVAVPGGSVVAVMRTFDPSWARSLVDSEVVLNGAVAQIHNRSRQTIGFRLMVPSECLFVTKNAPTDAFSLPESLTDSVRTYQEINGLQHRIRIRAVVMGGDSTSNLYVASGNGSLLVQAGSSCVAHNGDSIDFVGFPGSVETRPALLDSICRKAPDIPIKEPISRNADEILTTRMNTNPTRDDFASGMGDDMGLIRVKGTLLSDSPGPDGNVLFLQSGKIQFIALLPYTKMHSTRLPENGSQLQVVGICLVSYDQFHRAESFRVLLRDRADIVTLKSAPWWNLQNAFRSLLVAAFLLLAAIVRTAVQSRKLRVANDLLRELSFTDGLTGVSNRRKFDQTLEAECRHAAVDSTSVSLLMLDIDHFKALNDLYGHQRGDECLVQVAAAVRAVSLRACDLVFRYGGEEFAVVLPGCGVQDAFKVAERVRLAVLDLAIVNERSPFDQRVSVSTGVATIWPNERTLASSLITLADNALYTSKGGGRNRTSLSTANRDTLSAVDL